MQNTSALGCKCWEEGRWGSPKADAEELPSEHDTVKHQMLAREIMMIWRSRLPALPPPSNRAVGVLWLKVQLGRFHCLSNIPKPQYLQRNDGMRSRG